MEVRSKAVPKGNPVYAINIREMTAGMGISFDPDQEKTRTLLIAVINTIVWFPVRNILVTNLVDRGNRR